MAKTVTSRSRAPEPSIKGQARTIVSWCLYDFANSFYVVLPAVVWQVYYQDAIVGNADGRGDLWWGRIISLSMLIVAITSPMMGAVANFAGVRKLLLMAYTLACVSAVGLFGTVQPGMVLWGFAITVIANIGFEGGLVFYNAYLPEIAPPAYQGRVSGWGFGTGYAGSALGLLLVLAFVTKQMYTPAWITIAAAFLVFSMPAFLWLPKDPAARMSVVDAARGGVRESFQTFREIFQHKALRRFLLAYFFFEDGVNTVVYFAAGFAKKTLEFTQPEAIYLFLVVQLSALAGAFLWAKPTDTLGPKRVLLIVIVQWSAVVTAAYFVQTKMQFFGIAVLAGTGLGAVQAASRAFMASLTPRGREGDFFGFFSLCGKSAAIIGPLLFGQVSHATGGNQRLAILTVMILFILGGSLLLRVQAGGPSLERRV
jgi:MFS transporter, UMF1 family